MWTRSRFPVTAIIALSLAMTAAAQGVLPRPEAPFKGQIGRTAKDSKPDFPKEIQAPKGAPNILLIVTDDVGFGASSPFGGPVSTPVLERLAQNGLRYNHFHTTGLCSPTRAALITGRNHHTAHTGVVMELGTGFPGYNSLRPDSVAPWSEVLRQSGYSTSWFGKSHNIPDWQSSEAGPFTAWPTAMGFEYFFGFIGGDTDQWHSAIFEGTRPIETEEQRGMNPMHFDELMANRTINWIRTQHAMVPDKPFFAYYATGTAHAPHHAPKEWIARFRGQFDQGWDKVREETFARQKKMGIVPANTRLTPRPKEIPAWDAARPEQKRVYARMMEVFAGALAHADYQIGRVIDAVRETGELDNTLIIFLQGDNGASAEGTLQGLTNEVGVAANGVQETPEYLLSMIDELGGPLTYNHFPVGWAWAMNTPFQWGKQVASHFGGTRNGLVISWPARIKDKGAIRSQFHHVIDVGPTVLEATRLKFPVVLNGVQQKPVDGVSMVYSFDQAQAPSTRTTQYFEMLANRGIYHEGWMASTTPARLPWQAGSEVSPDDFKWELYNIAEDFSQANNLADKNPDKLLEMRTVFDREAGKHNVLPLDASLVARVDHALRPSLTRGRNVFTFYPGMIRIPEGSAPDTRNRSFSLVAAVEIPEGGADGILATQGGRFGGWALRVINGRPELVYALSNQRQHKTSVVGREALAPGRHTIRADFNYDGGGRGKGSAVTLLVDGKLVGEGRIDQTVANRYSLDETFDVGQDTGTPVVEDYAEKMPFRFSGKLEKLTVELK